jgi:hypothetical protein
MFLIGLQLAGMLIYEIVRCMFLIGLQLAGMLIY